MLALCCHRFGPPESLTLDEVEPPAAGSGEIVIEVAAAGVNYPDIWLIEGRFHYKPPLPFSPGLEVAGVVRAAGDGVGDYATGDRVMAMLRWGGFAERVRVRADERVIPIPTGLDWAHAASFGVTYGTSYHALADRAGLRAGETLVVLGASGGVGLAAVELGKLMGARVVACASSAEKLEACRRQGADDLVNYDVEDLRAAIGRLTGGKGADVVFDAVGGRYAEAALQAIGYGGRHLVVGYTAGDRVPVLLKDTLVKGCAIVGVASRLFAAQEPAKARANLRRLADWIADGRLDPLVSARYPLARAADALAAVRARRVLGKAVIVMGEAAGA